MLAITADRLIRSGAGAGGGLAVVAPAAASWTVPGAAAGDTAVGAGAAEDGGCPPIRARSNPVAAVPDAEVPIAAAPVAVVPVAMVVVAVVPVTAEVVAAELVIAAAGLAVAGPVACDLETGGTELNPGRGSSLMPASSTGMPSIEGAGGAGTRESAATAVACAANAPGWVSDWPGDCARDWACGAVGAWPPGWLAVVVCAPLVRLAVATRTGAGAGAGDGVDACPAAVDADWFVSCPCTRAGDEPEAPGTD